MNAQRFRFVLIGLILLSLGLIGTSGYFGVQLLQDKIIEVDHIRIEAEVSENARSSAALAESQFDDPLVSELHDYLQQVIPQQSYREKFIADIKKYADNTGVPIASLIFQDQQAAVGGTPGATLPVTAPTVKGAKAIPIEIVMGGSVPYDNFMRFLGKIENNLQHIQVLSLDMAPSTANRDVLDSAGLSIALYVEQ